MEKGAKGGAGDLAVDFVLYGVLAEIFGRANGFNKGMGGSMHAFFAPFGSMPNNAIVGGSADIAVGAALFKRINRKPGIVIANIGDGSSACGPVWEAMMVAAMDQYRTLWPKDVGGAPPILFSFFNNFYGMGGQTMGETMGFKVLARIGAGVNPDQMHAERVDGYNPLAVADAIERKKKILAGRPRPGSPGHRHLPLLGPFPLGCLLLPDKGRGGAVAGRGLHQELRRRTSSPAKVATAEELAAIQKSRRGEAAPDHGSRGLPGDLAAREGGQGIGCHRGHDVLQRQRGEAR